jgi:hypothetical protein
MCYLQANETYTITAAYNSGTTGDYTFTVEPAEAIPANGGSVQVNGVMGFEFTPDESGNWTFITSNNGSSDPILSLVDSNGNLIAHDDDGADDLNAVINIKLNANETYGVLALSFGAQGKYTLDVSLS